MKIRYLILIPLFLMALLLTACNVTTTPSSQTPPTTTATTASTQPLFSSLQELPRMDGSTANIPLAKLMMERLTGQPVEEDPKFSTTPNAYLNLVNRFTDILLVYEADEATKKDIADSKVELEYHPIGRDALVFLANEGNPVKSLTVKQIQDIYQGKITNWKEVGGLNLNIVAYQRAERSGSQALMVKLVMKELPLMKTPTELYPQEMGGLIDALASYNNDKNAIGYSVYYYAKNMYSQPGLKFLAVDGVMPSNDTIANGEYPFVNDFYAVIRKDEPEDSPARKMLGWILSEEGHQAIQDAGYVAIPKD